MTSKSVLPAVFSVVEEPAAGFVICRNGVVLKTPKEAWLTVPKVPLAEAVVGELRAQQPGKFDPAISPLTVLAYSAIDVIANRQEETVGQLIAYARTDLLCHRAEDTELALEQNKVWHPLLDWCAESFNAPLKVAAGVMPIDQPPESIKALHRVVEVCDQFQLAGLSQTVAVSGSLVLGLALASRRLDAEGVFAAAELDASFQMKKWGIDPAVQKRREGIKRDLEICEIWFGMLSR